MNKTNVKYWTSLALFIFEISFLYSFTFLFKQETYSLSSVLMAYVAPLFLMVYLIILAPFALKGFDRKLRRNLCLIGTVMLLLVMVYFSFSLLEAVVGFYLLKILIFVLLGIVSSLHFKILSNIESIDIKRFEDYTRFVIDAQIPFFDTKENARIITFISVLKIVCLILLSVSEFTILYGCFIIIFVLKYSLNVKMKKYFKGNFTVLKLLWKLTAIEMALFFVIGLCLYFGGDHLALLCILISNFKGYFIKEQVQYEKYREHLKERKLN